MNTAFVLMAQYNAMAIIPIEKVCADYFTHLTPEMLQRKVLSGQIKIPITRIEGSQKSAKGIHVVDLAAYIDQQRQLASIELKKLHK